MRNRILISAVLLLVAATATPQQQGTIDFNQPSCFISNELPILSVSTVDSGLLRAYFRRTGATDWCSVDGQNLGKASSVVLPRFENGAEIEYYFVVLKGRQVIAKSATIYKSRATEKCDTPFARHSINLVMECLPASQNPIASALNAGYHAASTTEDKTRKQSPEKPEHEHGH
jgi:hypothetical protein